MHADPRQFAAELGRSLKQAADKRLHPSMTFEDKRPDRPQLKREQIEPTTIYGNEALDYVRKRFQRTKLHDGR